MKTLIIGAGQIGKSLRDVLIYNYPVYLVDKDETGNSEYDIIHICFPYFKGFEDEVRKYQDWYKPKFTVVHSTVPVGTCTKVGAIHSPVIGIHPFLEESLKTFVKYLGGPKAGEVADYFRRAGMRVYVTDKSETTELMKILDTTFYGICVEYAKDVKQQCQRFNVPYEMWTLWIANYNEGYEKLGRKEYLRPNLVPISKKIGGHCVLPNCDLLETKFTDILKKLNY